MFIDKLFFDFLNTLCISWGDFFTPFFKFISFLGEKSWPCLIIGFVLLMRKKTRWVGVAILGSIFIAFIGTDFILKPLLHRPRPYLSDSQIYYKYWQDAGSLADGGFAMPSGHIAGLTAFFASLYFINKKNIIPLALVCIFLETCSRCYFLHHHLTDCLVGVLLGIISAFIGKIATKFLYKISYNLGIKI